MTSADSGRLDRQFRFALITALVLTRLDPVTFRPEADIRKWPLDAQPRRPVAAP